MVIDSSVLLQVLFKEDGANKSVLMLGQARQAIIASATVLETEIVYGARKGFQLGDVDELLERLGIRVEPFTREHAREAKLAYARFGKGQGHKAQLNYGDCISYALAKVAGLPLMFKGDDFNYTDIQIVKVG